MNKGSIPYFSTPPIGGVHEDSDPQETAEWLEALDAVAKEAGGERAQYIFDRLAEFALSRGVKSKRANITPYENTVSVSEQPPYPGDLDLEEKLSAAIRWNALAMVVRANRAYGELGGHIASYASAADLFEVGFNHFFQAEGEDHQGDLVYFQPHSSPGVYARAYLEGFLSEDNLKHYRQELTGPGLCSYPHPWLMPNFWQFPTGSMGIGPINAIFQARFLRYLHNRKLQETTGRKVWGFFGDGEMDEPESIGALTIAAREKLDNLVFVVNCNLQRLDGPVRSNGRIIDELEALFNGAGWNVIKVVWGSDWDELFARDKSNALLKAFASTVDGQFQTFSANSGEYNRERFFSQNPELAALASHLSDEDINRLKRGGHDVRKLHAAYAKAVSHEGQPTVILAKTMKGYGMGDVGQGRMTTHQQKKLDVDNLKEFRGRFRLPLSDDDVENVNFYRPADNSPEMQYLQAKRLSLGGYLPRRREQSVESLAIPPIEVWAKFALEANGKEMSTTMALVRMFTSLLKDKQLGPRIVPIVADEARTFGMASMFRQIGIYSPSGQMYEPEDMGSIMYYREETDGQILEEGISEAAALSSWIAAATSYSVNNLPMLPFYIYYSMFGFQRVGDIIWAAADQRARGFLIGATSGKTTLGGEGLQHQDGTSHIAASTIPNCRAYDPGFAYEVAFILDEGMREMGERQQDVFYYITVMNENSAQASTPDVDQEQLRDGVLKGMYRYSGSDDAQLQLMGSGAILSEVMKAQQLLSDDWNISAAVWSVTSYTELQRQGNAAEREQRLFDTDTQAYVRTALAKAAGPVIAATDYVRAVPELIRAHIPNAYITLGTDGFGRSDSRAALRQFFEVDAQSIVIAALKALVDEGSIDADLWKQALTKYQRGNTEMIAPWQC